MVSCYTLEVVHTLSADYADESFQRHLVAEAVPQNGSISGPPYGLGSWRGGVHEVHSYVLVNVGEFPPKS